METNIGILLSYLDKICQKAVFPMKRGAKYKYTIASFSIFFMIMALKGIHQFKTMHKYAQKHYQVFGWSSCPTRKTIRVRFESLPAILSILMPEIAKTLASLNKCFNFRWVFIDKSVFRALGGLWHTKHMKEGIIPHSSIDTEASWAKSDYHGWRFGYGLHLIVNEFRFPISAYVSTASAKDYSFVEILLTAIHHKISIVIGDRGYFCADIIEKIKNKFDILLQTIKPFEESSKHSIKDWYNDLILTPQAQWLYRLRKPSIEPTFALIKEIFNLKDESQLPFKGLVKVSAYLLICSLTIQIMMYHNYLNNLKLGDTTAFKTSF
jgi:Transposase DDE domain